MAILRKGKKAGFSFNEKWIKKVTFEKFKEDANVKKLSEKEAKELYDKYNSTKKGAK